MKHLESSQVLFYFKRLGYAHGGWGPHKTATTQPRKVTTITIHNDRYLVATAFQNLGTCIIIKHKATHNDDYKQWHFNHHVHPSTSSTTDNLLTTEYHHHHLSRC